MEWKTRGHDHAPGLHEALLDNGFVAEETESIMIGRAQSLAVDVELPEGVSLRRVSDEVDVRAMSAMQGVAFGDSEAEVDEMAEALLRRLALDDGMELWVAEADGRVVSAGRLEPVPRHRVRRGLGRRDARGVARPRNLPGPDGRARTIGARASGRP